MSKRQEARHELEAFVEKLANKLLGKSNESEE